MTQRLPSLLLLAALALMLCAPRPSYAARSYDNCTGFITSLPAVITTPGTWCLNADLSTTLSTDTSSGGAITIQADHVTVDCNEFRITALAGAIGANNAIFASNRRNATVRNCRIQGFFYGILLYQSSSNSVAGFARHIVEDSSFGDNTKAGIIVHGVGALVRRNRVTRTVATTGGAVGIEVESSADVLDNDISGVTGVDGSYADGIVAAFGAYGSINGNRIRGVSSGQSGQVSGIRTIQSSRTTMRKNDLSASGSPGSIGLECIDDFQVSRATDNVINGFAVPLTGCADAGGNDITP